MSFQAQQQLNALVKMARQQARGAYTQRIRQYECFKRKVSELNLSSSEYAYWIRRLANALKV